MAAPYAKTKIFLTGTVTTPADWNPADNTIHCIGAPGVTGTTTQGGAGSAYAAVVNAGYAANVTAPTQIGVSGTNAIPDGTANTRLGPEAGPLVRAQGGFGGGAGLAGNSIGDVKFSGGAASGTNKGGGGAGGPSGAGGNGGATAGGTANGGTVAGGTGGASNTAGLSSTIWTDNSGGPNNGLSVGPGSGGGGSTTAGRTGGAAGKYGGGPGAGPAGAGAYFNGVVVLQWNPPVTGGKMKVWNGSAWVEKPAKVWNGSAWVVKPVKVWNGSAWVLS